MFMTGRSRTAEERTGVVGMGPDLGLRTIRGSGGSTGCHSGGGLNEDVEGEDVPTGRVVIFAAGEGGISVRSTGNGAIAAGPPGCA